MEKQQYFMTMYDILNDYPKDVVEKISYYMMLLNIEPVFKNNREKIADEKNRKIATKFLLEHHVPIEIIKNLDKKSY